MNLLTLSILFTLKMSIKNKKIVKHLRSRQVGSGQSRLEVALRNCRSYKQKYNTYKQGYERLALERRDLHEKQVIHLRLIRKLAHDFSQAMAYIRQLQAANEVINPLSDSDSGIETD